MVSYSKHLYATVLRACTSAVDSLDFDRTRTLEQKWIKVVQTPYTRVRWQNEVLELLGDGVINACITAQICDSVKGSPSMLSMLKSVLTSNIVFASITKRMINVLAFPLDRLRGFLDIPEHGTIPTKSFADAFETMIGALHQDRGFSVVEACVSGIFKSLIVIATKAYHDFRNHRLPDKHGNSGHLSKKRKVEEVDEQQLSNKRPKFMSDPSSVPVPVIVDAGSGSEASLVQDLASALERRLKRTYIRHRDGFLRDVIRAISQESRRYTGSGYRVRTSIDRKLFYHGRKYIRMILAINDCIDDYPETDEDLGTEKHAIKPTNEVDNIELSKATISEAPCDVGPDDHQDEDSYVEDPVMLDTSMDLDIKEIELIDLVGDSDESADESLRVHSTDNEETDTEDIVILGHKLFDKSIGKQKELEVIDLLTSSEESDDDKRKVGKGHLNAMEVPDDFKWAKNASCPSSSTPYSGSSRRQRERTPKSIPRFRYKERHSNRVYRKSSRDLHSSSAESDDGEDISSGSDNHLIKVGQGRKGLPH